jgi:hypothetical protein
MDTLSRMKEVLKNIEFFCLRVKSKSAFNKQWTRLCCGVDMNGMTRSEKQVKMLRRQMSAHLKAHNIYLVFVQEICRRRRRPSLPNGLTRRAHTFCGLQYSS